MADKTITLKLFDVSTDTSAGAVTTLDLTAQEASVIVTAPADPQDDAIRLYRRGGSITEGWFQTGADYPLSTLSAGGSSVITHAAYPTAATNNTTAGDNDWVNPTYIEAPDGLVATYTRTIAAGTNNSHWLLGYVYNLPVPLHGAIVGIAVTVRGLKISGAAGGTLNISVFKNGVAIGTPVVDGVGSYGSTLTTVGYGGPTSLWGLTPSAADVTDSTFGIGIQLVPTGGVGTSISFGVDSIALQVYYDNTYAIIDNITDDGLGNQLLLDNDVPVTSVSGATVPLPFIWGPFQGRMLGCGDYNRPDAVYFSKNGNADQWGSEQWVTTSNPSEPMMMGCVYNTRCFAFSTERMYEMVPGLTTGVTFTPYPTPCAHGLFSPYALCAYDMIYFLSKDGIYVTTGGQEESIVENWIKPLFPTKDGPGVSVNGYEAIDYSNQAALRLTPHNDEIYFTYAGVTTGMKQTLAWDIRKKRWRAATYTPTTNTLYSEPCTTSSLLVGGDDGTLYQTQLGDDAGQPIIAHVLTGAQDQGIPLNEKEYGNVLFDLDPGGATLSSPITITPYLNAQAITEAAITVTGSGRQQIPLTLGDVYGFNIEFDIAWTATDAIQPILYQYDILWREEPVKVKHFEMRETSNELPGYQHMRDMYCAIRSDADVTLTLTFDNAETQVYTIPSTGGLRKKLYVPFYSNKFREVHWSFDSEQPFKLYQTDSEVKVKPWLSPLGYTIRKPFGADSVLTTAAFDAQLLRGQNG